MLMTKSVILLIIFLMKYFLCSHCKISVLNYMRKCQIANLDDYTVYRSYIGVGDMWFLWTLIRRYSRSVFQKKS